MSESLPTLTVGTWNIAAHHQSKRVGGLAEYLAMQRASITVVTELTAIEGLEKALTAEMGAGYSFDAINTGGTYYEDNIGLLVTGEDTTILDNVEAIPTGGKKMPYIMRARLATPVGEVNLVGMRGAYVAGKGTTFSFGSAERKRQYQIASEVAKDGDGVALLAGDMNSSIRSHGRIFERNDLRRLTSTDNTWPDREGLNLTTLDSRIMALPFSLTRQGMALDVIYGDDSVEAVSSRVDATGLSDHMYVEAVLTRAS